MTASHSETQWGSSYRLVASEKWKAKSAAMGKPLTEALVDYAEPRAGMQVLDVASGTGEPAITLASRVGPSGHVTALDLSSELLEIAASRARQRGFSNISLHTGDAHTLPFADNSFDLATCRFGVMFFRDPVQALRELHRVLKPGARACFAVWGPFEQPYWQSAIAIAARHVGGPLLPPDGQDPFCFSNPERLSAPLRNAGFTEVQADLRALPWVWPGSPEEVWEYQRSVSAPFRALLDRVPEQQWPEINREVHAAIGKYVRGDQIEFGAQIVFASGRK